jgi:hypothetical protein
MDHIDAPPELMDLPKAPAINRLHPETFIEIYENDGQIRVRALIVAGDASQCVAATEALSMICDIFDRTN